MSRPRRLETYIARGIRSTQRADAALREFLARQEDMDQAGIEYDDYKLTLIAFVHRVQGFLGPAAVAKPVAARRVP
jgi:hypothetical protein